RGEAVVIPVILRPCAWQDTAFGRLLATPRDGKAITSWANRDEAFRQVVEAIRDVAVQRAKPSKASAAIQSHPGETASMGGGPGNGGASPRGAHLHRAGTSDSGA